MSDDPREGTEPVLGNEPTGYSVQFGARTYEVIGKITRNRALLMHELGFLRGVSYNLKRATPSTMQQYLAELDDKIDLIAKGIHRTLTDLGDIDPRHPNREIEDEPKIVVTRTVTRGQPSRVRPKKGMTKFKVGDDENGR